MARETIGYQAKTVQARTYGHTEGGGLRVPASCRVHSTLAQAWQFAYTVRCPPRTLRGMCRALWAVEYMSVHGHGHGHGQGRAYRIAACAGVLGWVLVRGVAGGGGTGVGAAAAGMCAWTLDICLVARRLRRNWEQDELSNGVSSDFSSWRMGERTRLGKQASKPPPRRGRVWRCCQCTKQPPSSPQLHGKVEDDFFIGVRGYSCL
jgi:hypothetical protein